MSIASEIERLQEAKSNIKAAIENCGVEVPSSAKLDVYHEYIAQISSANSHTGDLSYMNTLRGEFGDTRNTANCYIVYESGTYRFPLVYGNGIKDNEVNSQAYSKISSTYAADFVNHLGNTLTSPYIELNTGCTPESASLLWQTGTNLISSISLKTGSDCDYLEFVVNSIPQTNGLAVLTVKDHNSDIIWSWMIWLMAQKPFNEVYTNATSVGYTMLSEHLGSIWASDRNHYVSTYYQWGRKDPFPPSESYNSTTRISLYDINGNAYNGIALLGTQDGYDSRLTVPNSIKNPNLFFTRYSNPPDNWNNLSYFFNFWNAASVSTGASDNQSSAVKTIYDPCPPGYMLPGPRFFTGFSVSNTIGSFSNGYRFKKNSSDTVGVYMETLGVYNMANANIANLPTYGYLWTYGNYTQNRSYSPFWYNGTVTSLDYNGRVYGMQIRPAKELT